MSKTRRTILPPLSSDPYQDHCDELNEALFGSRKISIDLLTIVRNPVSHKFKKFSDLFACSKNSKHAPPVLLFGCGDIFLDCFGGPMDVFQGISRTFLQDKISRDKVFQCKRTETVKREMTNLKADIGASYIGTNLTDTKDPRNHNHEG